MRARHGGDAENRGDPSSDVVGYSRLAGADEDRTLARLRALRSDLIDPDNRRASWPRRQAHRRWRDRRVPQRRRRRALAIEVQHGMVERNAGVPAERRIEFRIGIHLGDVVEESDGDLMGDGVNIAARIRAWPSLAGSAFPKTPTAM